MKRRLLFILLAGCVQALAQEGLKRHYGFDEPLGSQWVYIQTPDPAQYTSIDGKLRLYGSRAPLSDNEQPTFVGLRQESAKFTFDTKISRYDMSENEEAGICVYQSPQRYVQCAISSSRSGFSICVQLCLNGAPTSLIERHVNNSRGICLRVSSDSLNYSFYYSSDGKTFRFLQSVPCSQFPAEDVDSTDSILLGLYAFQGSTKYQMGRPFADFDYVDYTEE